MSNEGRLRKMESTKKENNDLKEIIRRENEISETSEIEKDIVELILIKKEEDDENNEAITSDLKYFSKEKEKQ